LKKPITHTKKKKRERERESWLVEWLKVLAIDLKPQNHKKKKEKKKKP
jgi:hypothetical protein